MEVGGLFYRRCAAALVFNARGEVLVGERRDKPGSWNMPQGGIEVRVPCPKPSIFFVDSLCRCCLLAFGAESLNAPPRTCDVADCRVHGRRCGARAVRGGGPEGGPHAGPPCRGLGLPNSTCCSPRHRTPFNSSNEG